MIYEILFLLCFIIYNIFISINFMDNYSESSRLIFKEVRNWRYLCSILLIVMISLLGGFDNIFEYLNII